MKSTLLHATVEIDHPQSPPLPQLRLSPISWVFFEITAQKSN